MPQAEKKLFLLDAMALIYRAYFSLARSPRITSHGRNTNAQFGFTTTLLDLLSREKPTHLAVVFEGGKTDTDVHRTNVYADYKANRQEAPEDITNALPDIQEIIRGFNLPVLSSPGYEADDVIGTLALEAAQLGYTVYMVTPDKDYGQLVRDKVFMYKPAYMGGSIEVFGPEEICAKWSIKRVDQVIDILGLMGDASDNIPGIAGVGEKTAAKLLAQYDTLEGVLEHAGEIKGVLGQKVIAGKESAIMSKQLATIVTNVPVLFNEKDFRVEEMDREALTKIFDTLEFKALGRRVLGAEYDGGGPPQAVALDLFGQPIGKSSAAPAASIGPVAPLELKTIADTPHEYKLIDEPEQLETLLQALKEEKILGFDTETTSKDANDAELVGLSFCWEKGKAHYVFVPEERTAADALLQRFKPLFDDPSITWVGQNLKYDFGVLRWYGIKPAGRVWDTMLAHYLLDPEGKRSMDVLSAKYLGYEPVSIESLIGKKGKDQGNMRGADLAAVAEYAAEDADVVWQLRNVFEPMLKAQEVEGVFTSIECPLVPVLAGMEVEGIRVDVPFLNEYSKELAAEIASTEAAVYEIAGTKFNIGSPRQLGELLFDVLKIEGGGKKTKTGQYATGEEVLSKLKGTHPIVDSILAYREMTKLKSTYVDALPQLINARTGRVHTCFNQAVAVTGRLSSNAPNLQNIPIRTERGREIRKAFIPRQDGWWLLSADYSQIELRIIAGIAKEDGMIAAFADGKDIHTATAAGVYGVAETEVTGDMRRAAKAVNFGIIYGQSAFGLSQTLGVPRAEAKTIIENYFQTYPAIQRYLDTQISFAKKHGYVETLRGRKRYLRDIHSANQTVRGFAERNAINMPIQGTAADMIKLAMIAVDKALKSRPVLQTRMILQVHDELIFDVPEGEAAEVRELVVKAMEGAMTLLEDVPIVAEAGQGKNWLEAH